MVEQVLVAQAVAEPVLVAQAVAEPVLVAQAVAEPVLVAQAVALSLKHRLVSPLTHASTPGQMTTKFYIEIHIYQILLYSLFIMCNVTDKCANRY